MNYFSGIRLMVVDPVHIIITYRRALHTGKQLFMGRRKKQTIKLFWHFLIKEFLLGEKKKGREQRNQPARPTSADIECQVMSVSSSSLC